MAPSGLEKIFLLTTGSETCECAIKLARTHGRQINDNKITIVSYQNAFHGRTLGSQMVGGVPGLKQWIVNLDKDFIGKEVVAKAKENKPDRRLVCLELEGRAFPRHGYEIFINGTAAGQVTSGTFSPSLQKPIALGYVPRSHAKSGSTVEVAIRNKRFPATVVRPPFYKHGSHK